MAKRKAEIEVSLRDRATKGLKRLSSSFRGIAKGIGIVTAAAGALTGIIGARFLSGAIRSAGDFTEAMTRVGAVTGAGAQEMEALRAAADEAGTTTRFTATEAANGLEELARSGQNANQAIQTLEPVLALAAGNNQSVAESALQVTTALNSFGLAAEEAGRVSDVYTRAAQRSAQTTGQLSEAMTFVAPVAKQAGLDVEQTASLVGKLADQGFRASLGGTALRNAILQLQDPSSKFRDELSKLGIESTDFIEVLEGLDNAGDDAEAAIRSLGLRAGPAIQALVSGGAPALRELVGELRDAEGASADAAVKLEQNLPGALRGLGSAFDAARRKLVEPLVEKLTADIQTFSGQVRKFVESDALKSLQQLLTGAFDSARESVLAFIDEVDFSEVQRRLREFVDSSLEKMGDFRDGLAQFGEGWDKTAGAIQIAVGTIKTAFNGLGIVLSSALDLVVGSFARAAEAADKATFGLVNAVSRTADELRLIQQDIRSTTGDFIDQAAEANEQIAAGFNRWANAGKNAGDQVKAGMDTAAESVDQVAESSDRAAEAADRLKNEMFLAGQSAESLGLSGEKASEGLDETVESVAKLERVTGDFGNGIETRLVSQIETVKPRADEAAESLEDLAEAGKDSLDDAAEAGERAGDAVDGVGDAAERTQRRVGAVGRYINGILNSWRTLSESAAAAVETFVNSSTVNSVQGYFTRLSRFTQGLQESQDRQIEQADRLIEQYRRTGNALIFAEQAQNLLNTRISLLDPSKVQELESAIAAARAEIDSARESSAGLVRELEDDLLRLQGRTEEIEERRRQRRRDEIQLQLRSNDLDLETRRNLEQALRLMDKQAEVRRQQAADSAASAAGNELAAEAAEREAEAAERTAEAVERTSRTRPGAAGDGTLKIEIETRAAQQGAPTFTQSDLAQLATRLTPLIVQEIRNDQGLGL